MHDPGARIGRTVQTVDKGLTVLTCFTPESPEWGITALAVHVGMPKSAVHKILASFQRWGVVAQDRQTRRYRLGLRVLQLAEAVSPSRELREEVGEQMDFLARMTRETIALRVIDGEESMTLDIRESPEQMRMTGGVGRRYPLYAGASNLVLMAHLPRSTVEQIVQNRAPNAHKARLDFPCFWSRLEQIREQGYVMTIGEVEPGVAAIAAPIRDYSSRVIAGISISGPTYRIPEERMGDLVKLVCEAAARSSRRLGAPT